MLIDLVVFLSPEDESETNFGNCVVLITPRSRRFITPPPQKKAV
jgi:hypothetical protein